MKNLDRVLLIVVVLSSLIVILDAATAHAWAYLDLLWFLRR